MENAVNKRLMIFIKNNFKSQKEFSDLTGINNQSISNLFYRNNHPSVELLQKIKNASPNLSIEWLLFGTGNMFIEISDQKNIGINTLNSINAISKLVEKTENNFGDLIETIKDLSGKLAVAEHKINELEKQLLQKSKTINDLEFRERGK